MNNTIENYHHHNHNNHITKYVLELIKNETNWDNHYQNNNKSIQNNIINASNIIINRSLLPSSSSTLSVLNVTENFHSFNHHHDDISKTDVTLIDNNNNNNDHWTIIDNLTTTTTTIFSDFNETTLSINDFNSDWWNVWTSKPFPSGYTQLSIVLLAFFLTCIIILVVVGNLLVCIAIATEKALKPVQNWFIASLAVSDLLIGLVIMPFSLARELMGYWMFGQVWCDIHAALDVLLCTASINSLFLISLDRYWSITQAVKYLKKRTPSRAAMMIAFVWIFSAFVSLPPLVGWKKAEQSSEYPQCNLSDDIGYVLYSSIGSFYFPALMMVFVYAKIFIAARSRARKHIAKKRFKIPTTISTTANETMKEKSTTTTLCTSFSNPSPPDNIINNNNNNNDKNNNNNNNNNEHHHCQQHHHHHHYHHHRNDVDDDVIDDDDEDDEDHNMDIKNGVTDVCVDDPVVVVDDNEEEDDDDDEQQTVKMNLIPASSSTNEIHSQIRFESDNYKQQQQQQQQSKKNNNSIIDNEWNVGCDIRGSSGGGGGNLMKTTTTTTALPPQIIIETSSESRRQSWNIISTSEIISTLNTTTTNNNNQTTTSSPNGNNDDHGNKQQQQQQQRIIIDETNNECSGRISKNYNLNEINNDSVDNNSNNNDHHSYHQPSPTTKLTYFSKVKTFKLLKPKTKKINGLSKNSNNNNNSISTTKSNGTIDDDSDTADSPTNKDASCESKSFLSAPKLLRSRFGSTLSIADYEDSDTIVDDDHNHHHNQNNNNKKNKRNNRVQYQDQPSIHLPSDAERHKRKIAKARERRATLIVGLIMAAFITAWLPFFVLYVLVALCQNCKENIPEGVFAVAFWLGYAPEQIK
ncbi:Alpha-2B adrenergic receptor [Dermatophagoides pteronyssinus]|uniref:Alpha-2B adrenergic receptor n=1 Tax=Dermatophagoides pteronyssinus TaxID=6956 RepID=A0ABQ8IYM6_DERPT|nr:Alpha-2B adrenergic receptor [Dermatophagoides pteronyssinus]